ncbi:hypothetical protein SEVIR_3G267525v4 [Setaria viridis]|nr:uncharacterized protein LOC117848005 [Setaria viridis]
MGPQAPASRTGGTGAEGAAGASCQHRPPPPRTLLEARCRRLPPPRGVAHCRGVVRSGAAVPHLERAAAMGEVALGGGRHPWRWAGLRHCSEEEACGGAWRMRRGRPAGTSASV